jgi:hypothetical protein
MVIAVSGQTLFGLFALQLIRILRDNTGFAFGERDEVDHGCGWASGNTTLFQDVPGASMGRNESGWISRDDDMAAFIFPTKPRSWQTSTSEIFPSF